MLLNNNKYQPGTALQLPIDRGTPSYWATIGANSLSSAVDLATFLTSNSNHSIDNPDVNVFSTLRESMEHVKENPEQSTPQKVVGALSWLTGTLPGFGLASKAVSATTGLLGIAAKGTLAKSIEGGLAWGISNYPTRSVEAPDATALQKAGKLGEDVALGAVGEYAIRKGIGLFKGTRGAAASEGATEGLGTPPEYISAAAKVDEHVADETIAATAKLLRGSTNQTISIEPGAIYKRYPREVIEQAANVVKDFNLEKELVSTDANTLIKELAGGTPDQKIKDLLKEFVGEIPAKRAQRLSEEVYGSAEVQEGLAEQLQSEAGTSPRSSLDRLAANIERIKGLENALGSKSKAKGLIDELYGSVEQNSKKLHDIIKESYDKVKPDVPRDEWNDILLSTFREAFTDYALRSKDTPEAMIEYGHSLWNRMGLKPSTSSQESLNYSMMHEAARQTELSNPDVLSGTHAESIIQELQQSPKLNEVISNANDIDKPFYKTLRDYKHNTDIDTLTNQLDQMSEGNYNKGTPSEITTREQYIEQYQPSKLDAAIPEEAAIKNQLANIDALEEFLKCKMGL